MADRVAEFEAPPSVPKALPARSDRIGYACLAVYGLVVAAAIWRHEPWADEAHSWLLARDASLVDLWTRLLHYEGTPGLWQSLLHILIRLGMPYRGEGVTSGLLGLAAAAMLMRRAPFPAWVRLLLPFTYFLCYQYVVVARSYSLLAPLLFAAALLYSDAERRNLAFTVILCLLAAVSVHGFLLSAALWSAAWWHIVRRWKQIDAGKRRQLIGASAGYFVILMLLAAASWPAKDVTFPAHAAFDPGKVAQFASMLLAQGFTGSIWLTLLVLALSVPYLYQGVGLWFFVISTLALAGFGGLVYSQVWHSGTLLLAWVTAMWISGPRPALPRSAMVAFAIVIAVQCYWTIRTVSYDWGQPYSGSKDAAAYIRRTGIANHRINAVGYSCSAIQPYFAHGLFANYPPGRAYWDWSTRSRVNDPSALFSSQAPEYVVVGYKASSDMDWLSGFLQHAGYRQLKHFDGHLFWETHEFELEDFDLYGKAPTASAPQRSFLDMADERSSEQLVSGFYNQEQHAWRWSARSFSAVLKPPAAGSAQLELHLYLSAEEIAKLGPMTLSADLSGHSLAPQTFTRAGSYVYERDVPAAVLRTGSVLASFHFDRALPPADADGRELGAVISSLGLKPKP